MTTTKYSIAVALRNTWIGQFTCLIKELVETGDKSILSSSNIVFLYVSIANPEEVTVQSLTNEIFQGEKTMNDFKKSGDRTLFSNYLDMLNRLDSIEFCHLADTYKGKLHPGSNFYFFVS